MTDLESYEHRQKYPETNEEINVVDYHNLVLKVFNSMVNKFGKWLYDHKADLVQSGYVGLLKAKEKYTPGRGSFLGLAYLRIMSAMQNDIAKYAKHEMNTISAEDLKSCTQGPGSEKLDWNDMFPAVILDYDSIFKMVTNEDDKKVLVGIINMYPYWKLRNILGETKQEHDDRVLRIKEDLVEILEILHPNL